MGEGSNLLNLILLAIAVGVFLKLRSVLGRRTGNERPPYDPYSAPEKTPSGNDKVIALPKRAQPGAQQQAQTDETPRPDRWAGIVPEGSALSQTLTEISLADRAFDAGAFLSGARMAYEMIVTAFARGDRQTLQPLLDEHVFKSFSEAEQSRILQFDQEHRVGLVLGIDADRKHNLKICLAEALHPDIDAHADLGLFVERPEQARHVGIFKGHVLDVLGEHAQLRAALGRRSCRSRKIRRLIGHDSSPLALVRQPYRNASAKPEPAG